MGFHVSLGECRVQGVKLRVVFFVLAPLFHHFCSQVLRFRFRVSGLGFRICIQ